jgi:uncharacterized membrane protein
VSAPETVAVDPETLRATPWRMVMVMGGADVTHFTNPGFYEEIVPKWAPGSKEMWVKVSGVAELACAALMISPKTRRLGGWITVGTLLSVWTANIQVALDGGMEGDSPLQSKAAAWIRVPFQIPMILDALKIARRG